MKGITKIRVHKRPLPIGGNRSRKSRGGYGVFLGTGKWLEGDKINYPNQSGFGGNQPQ